MGLHGAGRRQCGRPVNRAEQCIGRGEHVVGSESIQHLLLYLFTQRDLFVQNLRNHRRVVVIVKVFDQNGRLLNGWLWWWRWGRRQWMLLQFLLPGHNRFDHLFDWQQLLLHPSIGSDHLEYLLDNGLDDHVS